MEINHKDGRKQNNDPSNLELVTRSQNTIHAVRALDRIIRPRATPGAKLSQQQVREIRDLWERKAMTQPELARHYGVSIVSIQGIVYRRTWKHVL
jgi:DNA-binding transcriptional regulator YiaG